MPPSVYSRGTLGHRVRPPWGGSRFVPSHLAKRLYKKAKKIFKTKHGASSRKLAEAMMIRKVHRIKAEHRVKRKARRWFQHKFRFKNPYI